MGILMQDLRFAVRQMAKKPGFAAVVVLTMALGIGANAAIFSVLDAVLLRPLPYSNPERLIKVWTRFTGIGAPNDQNWVSAPEFRDFQQLNSSFSDLAAIGSGSINLGVKGSPQRVVGASVSPSLFPMLGAQTLLGRTFLPEEAQPGRDHEVLLSYGLWRRVFGGNRNVIGSTIDIDGVPMSVVGVMPEGFAYPDEAEIWGPLAFSPDDLSESSRGNHGFEVLGRMKPGLSLAQVQSDMDRVGRTIIEQHGSYPYTKFDFGIILHPLLEETVGDVKPSLMVLMAAVGLVLLIACANIANLLLVRSTERQQEMETRMALGASGARLMRQLLTESVVLAFAGGVVGVAITPWILHGLVRIAAKSLPRAIHTSIDGRALLLTAAISLATGILFGLAPALQTGRKREFQGLKGGRSTEGKRPKRLRSVLVICETALSLLLIAAAGLLMTKLCRDFEGGSGIPTRWGADHAGGVTGFCLQQAGTGSRILCGSPGSCAEVAGRAGRRRGFWFAAEWPGRLRHDNDRHAIGSTGRDHARSRSARGNSRLLQGDGNFADSRPRIRASRFRYRATRCHRG